MLFKHLLTFIQSLIQMVKVSYLKLITSLTISFQEKNYLCCNFVYFIKMDSFFLILPFHF